jgi:hypothetical protein
MSCCYANCQRDRPGDHQSLLTLTRRTRCWPPRRRSRRPDRSPGCARMSTCPCSRALAPKKCGRCAGLTLWHLTGPSGNGGRLPRSDGITNGSLSMYGGQCALLATRKPANPAARSACRSGVSVFFGSIRSAKPPSGRDHQGSSLSRRCGVLPHGGAGGDTGPAALPGDPVEQMSDGALARMRPDLSIGTALPPAGR